MGITVHTLGSLRRPLRFSPGRGHVHAGSVWIHFGVLIAAIVGTNALKSEPPSLFAVLYAWMPLLVGVAVSIRPATRQCIRTSLSVAAAASLLMVVLDVGGPVPESGAPTAVLRDGEVRKVETLGSPIDVSWVRTGVLWIRGDLPGTARQTPAYVPGNPRLTALEALTDLSLFLLCFATPGIVLAVSSWMRRHARFDSSANEAGARIAVAWLVSAAVMFGAQTALASQRFDVLFEGAPLWSLLTPSAGFIALGAAGFLAAARSDESSFEAHP